MSLGQSKAMSQLDYDYKFTISDGATFLYGWVTYKQMTLC